MSNIGVLLATYNGERFIKDQMDSLLNQTYQDFICYIHDDGSNDHTVAICKEYEKKYPSKFKILEYKSEDGAKNNFFSLMNYIDSKYVMFCDQDDVWLPNKIEEMFSAVIELDGDFLAFADMKIVDEELNVIEESFYRAMHIQVNKIDYKNALIKGFIPGCAMMVNQGLMQKALQFKNIEHIKMHDWWLTIVALATDSKIVFVNKPLGLYRQHSTNTIGAKNQTTMDRIRFNLKRVIQGTLQAEKKKNIITPRKQAAELLNVKEINGDKHAFILEYSNIGNDKKLRRVWFYIKNFRCVYRMWWMLLWV